MAGRRVCGPASDGLEDNTMRKLLAPAFLALLLPAWTARAQEAAPVAVIEAHADQELSEFLDRMADATGETILYDPRNARIAKQTIGAGFRHEVPAERLFDTYRALLSFFELVLVPVGPEGHEIHLVVDSRSTNQLLRSKVTHVPYGELEDYADRDGLYIACAVPVQHVENLTILRTGLSTMLTPGCLGRLSEVPGSGTLLITDFAPTVAAMARLIRDADHPERQAKLEYLELAHADARGLADVITRLLALPATPQRAPQAYGAFREPPRVLAWEHGNALVVSALPDDVERIRAIVERLDRPVRSERITRILALRDAGARYAAAVIESTLKDRRAEGGVAIDAGTNAVIVTSDKATIEALRDLVASLEAICAML